MNDAAWVPVIAPGVRRLRRTARIYVVDPGERVLLFRYDPPAMPSFWATPGGEVDLGETFAEAARRELLEETGIDADPGPAIAERRHDYTAFWGECLTADERYYLVRVADARIDTSGFEPVEREIMGAHRWWPLAEIAATGETIYPPDIIPMLEGTLDPMNTAEGGS